MPNVICTYCGKTLTRRKWDIDNNKTGRYFCNSKEHAEFERLGPMKRTHMTQRPSAATYSQNRHRGVHVEPDYVTLEDCIARSGIP